MFHCSYCKSEVAIGEKVCKCCKRQPINRADVYLCETNVGILPIVNVQNQVGNRHSPCVIALYVHNDELILDTFSKLRLRRPLGRLKGETVKEVDGILHKLLFRSRKGLADEFTKLLEAEIVQYA